MNQTYPDIKDILLRLGYNDKKIPDILAELDNLFQQIDFDTIREHVESSAEEKDTDGLITSLQDLMVSLEDKGYYRPDYPTPLIRLLVNGLHHGDEDIFITLIKSRIPEAEKLNDIELLASCAAITQLGYIFLSCLVPEVRSATAGPHVFLLTESFSSDSMIFVDFSIDSIKKIDVDQLYEVEKNNYHLKNALDLTGLDEETSKIFTGYYSSFRVTEDIGLNHNIHNNLGIIYDKLERYEDAVTAFQEALRLDPGYNEVRNNLAVTFFRMESPEEAIKMLHEAIGLNPGYAEAHSNLGNIYAHSGKFKEAIQELEEAIRLNPGFAGAHNNLGNIYAEQENNEEAMKQFQEAVKLDPDNAFTHNNLGNIYAELKKYEEAAGEFENALKINPELAVAYQGAGLVYFKLGSLNRAVQAWIKAVHLEPDLMESVPDELALKVRMGLSRVRGRI